jgi:Hydrolytic ATP binding site of dynein motor region
VRFKLTSFGLSLSGTSHNESYFEIFVDSFSHNFLKTVSAGSVVCLIDAHRLQPHVTSMANELLKHILTAFFAASTTISLLGEKLRVDSNGLYIATVGSNFSQMKAREGSFCNMGSTFCEMPQYLAAQYRTVGVRLPPLRLLAEMILTSEGKLVCSSALNNTAVRSCISFACEQ